MAATRKESLRSHALAFDGLEFRVGDDVELHDDGGWQLGKSY